MDLNGLNVSLIRAKYALSQVQEDTIPSVELNTRTS